MPRDYARKAPKKRKSKKSVRFEEKKQKKEGPKIRLRWPLLLLCLAIIAFLIFFFSARHAVNNNQGAIVTTVQGTPVNSATTQTQPTQTATPPPKHDVSFNFEKPSSTHVANQSIAFYMIQLGSYADADPKMQILEKKLQSISVKYHLAKTFRKDILYYRVEVGPFHTKDAAEKMWNTLYEADVVGVIRAAYKD